MRESFFPLHKQQTCSSRTSRLRTLCVHACMLSWFSCVWLCYPMDCSLPGSSVHRILQARIPEWAAILSSRGSTDPGIKPASLKSPALAGGFFTTSTSWEARRCTVYTNYLTKDYRESTECMFVIQLLHTFQTRAKYFGDKSHMSQVLDSHLLLTVILLNALILWCNFSGGINLEQLKIM